MELNAQELELAAVSAAVAAGCVPCTRHHIKACKTVGAGSEQVVAAVRLGAAIAEASFVQVWSTFDPDVTATRLHLDQSCIDRQSSLCAIGAAVASNNVDQLRRLIRHATIFDISDSQIMEVVALADRIKAKAATHLEGLVDQLDADRSDAIRAATLCS